MAPSSSLGTAGKPAKKPSPFADRRILVLIALVVGIAGFYGFQSWRAGANRDAARSKLLAATVSELAKDAPDRDVLSKLMARLVRLPNASTSSALLAPQAAVPNARTSCLARLRVVRVRGRQIFGWVRAFCWPSMRASAATLSKPTRCYSRSK
jgi:hypothetical protein